MDLTNTDDIISLFESDDTLQLLIGAVINRARALLDEHDPNAMHFQQPFDALGDMLQSAAAGDTTMVITDDVSAGVVPEGTSIHIYINDTED